MSNTQFYLEITGSYKDGELLNPANLKDRIFNIILSNFQINNFLATTSQEQTMKLSFLKNYGVICIYKDSNPDCTLINIPFTLTKNKFAKIRIMDENFYTYASDLLCGVDGNGNLIRNQDKEYAYKKNFKENQQRMKLVLTSSEENNQLVLREIQIPNQKQLVNNDTFYADFNNEEDKIKTDKTFASFPPIDFTNDGSNSLNPQINVARDSSDDILDFDSLDFGDDLKF